MMSECSADPCILRVCGFSWLERGAFECQFVLIRKNHCLGPAEVQFHATGGLQSSNAGTCCTLSWLDSSFKLSTCPVSSSHSCCSQHRS